MASLKAQLVFEKTLELIISKSKIKDVKPEKSDKKEKKEKKIEFGCHPRMPLPGIP